MGVSHGMPIGLGATLERSTLMTRWIEVLRGRAHAELPEALRRGGAVEAILTSDRDAGDRARSCRDWPEAAASYRRYLAGCPDDGAIWMQLGHASKEAGDLDAAEAAYRSAEALLPGDADVHLQIGHLLKLRGRGRDAASAYAAALRLMPGSEAYGELVRLGRVALADQLATAGARPASPVLFLQVSDLLNFLRVHKTPSGIQRVQLGILQSTLDGHRPPAGPLVEFVVTRPNDTTVWTVSRPALASILDQLDRSEVDHPSLRSAIDAAMASATPVRPRPGDSVVVLGAFWGRPDNAPLLNTLRRQGVSIGVYLYDIIPLTHPEYCDHQLVVDFTSDFCEMLGLVDFALSISEFTAAQVRAFTRANRLPEPPIAVVPLSHNLTGQDHDGLAGDDAPDWTGEIAGLRGRDFVLCVCTIEPRKNHRYLFDVWKVLKAEGVAVPDLVFVGRRGWNVDDFFAQLRNSDWLGGSVRIVHDLSDRQLATLYGSCLFTTFPSIVEGWGLPVGESLSHGRLCVSSNASSMPEVGGDCTVYVDPLNLRDGIVAFRDLILNRNLIVDWERRIRSDFKARNWNDVSDDLFGAVARLGSAPRRVTGELSAELTSGRIVDIGRFARGTKLRPLRDYVALERLALGDSFYPPEQSGAWMKGRSGALRFLTGLPAGRRVVCYLMLKGAPNVDGGDVSISGAVDPVTHPLLANRTDTLRLKGTVGDAGGMEISLNFAGCCPSHVPDYREFCLSLVAFGFADVEDPIARAELLEGFLVDAAGLRSS